ncbi:hypothetical protein BJV74DRAFT_867848 [Russula compacta]|nr:hypothetical protein BJV74DRAFT_867848 [Russula compacta]
MWRAILNTQTGQGSSYNNILAALAQPSVVDVCLVCNRMPAENGTKFCSVSCGIIAFSSAPTILEIPTGNTDYRDVVNQFTKKWEHPTQVPTVIKVWKIYGKLSVLGRFTVYRAGVEHRTGIPGGNTRRRFHGTIRKCCLGDTSFNRALCSDRSCSMCRIIEISFQLSHVGQHTYFSRFGAGIYTTATSSKANDYYDGRMSPSPNKAMLLNDVVIGRAAKFYTTEQRLTAPPAGYDSVIGEPSYGGDLNYDECAVYNDAAIRPKFLIVYR